MVALRKESVDRNPWRGRCVCALALSLSARRAWIEIAKRYKAVIDVPVALRKESVDRNCYSYSGGFAVYPSLSARRAWIEI